MTERQDDIQDQNQQDADETKPDGFQAKSEENLFEFILGETKESLANESVFPKLVEFVRSQRLPSKFSFENLEELTRFVVTSGRMKKLEFDHEACIEFVASALYDDPSCRLNCEQLWLAIINRISAPS